MLNNFFGTETSSSYAPGTLPVGGTFPVTITTAGIGAGLTQGALYYDAVGTWTLADATALGTGGREDVAIAMGTDVSDGMMLSGWLNVPVALWNGTWSSGLPVWMSELTAGEYNAHDVVPAAVGNVRRIMAHMTDVANIIAFFPDPTYGVVTP